MAGNKSKRVVGWATLWLAVGLLVAGPLWAEEAAAPVAEKTAVMTAEPTVDWDKMRSDARDLRQKAKTMRSDAKKTLTAAEAACWKKTVFVTRCQNEAREVQRNVEREAQKVDIKALQLERQMDEHRRELKAGKKAEQERRQAEKMAKRAERMKQEEEDRQRKLAQLAEKEKRAEEKRQAKEAELARKLKHTTE